MKQNFKAEMSSLPMIVKAIEDTLIKLKTEPKTRIRTMLAAEESATKLIEHSKPGSQLSLSVRRVMANINVVMTVPGEKFEFIPDSPGLAIDQEMVGPESESLIRSIVLKSFSSDIRYQNKADRNIVRLKTARSPRAFLYQTLSALVTAIVLGLLMRLVFSAEVNAWVASNILGTVQTLFMNGLKMVVAPVVFLSIAGSITQFSNLRDVGRIGSKVILVYFLTSVIAVTVGIGYSLLFQPGDPSLAAAASDAAAVHIAGQTSVSILDTIKGIVPDNFLKSFAENNMLQLIFLAVISGVALNALGEKGAPVKRMFDALQEFFMKITGYFIRLVPLMVFCSLASTLMTAGTKSILSVLSAFGIVLLGLMTMTVVYCLIVAAIGRINPLIMLRKYAGTMIQVFSLSSSNASISLNMTACDKKLGVSPKLYSLSIPLGATLNMDGLCVNLSVMTLFLARVFGVQLDFSQLLQIGLTIILISMGMPGIPGMALIGLAMILTQINVPLEGISLIMGIYAIVDMFETVSNCLGDVSTTVAVARTEGLLNKEIYYSK